MESIRIVRQYAAENIAELEESLHIVFQHKRVKGEWFELNPDELIICDNIACNYALGKYKNKPKNIQRSNTARTCSCR